MLRLTGGAGADLVLESAGAGFAASLAAARPVAGRVVVLGLAGGDAAVTNWELVYRYQVLVIGLNIGVLARRAPHVFGAVMGELAALVAAGVVNGARETAAGGDLAFPGVTGRRTIGMRIAAAYLPRLMRAATHDADLARALVRVIGMVDGPETLMRPHLVYRALRG